MATKIRKEQIEEIIQPQASADWTRDDITASAYAIAAKIASSGVRKITTNYKIWELEEGVYHVDGTKQANYRGGSFTIYQNYYLFVANYNHVTPDKKRYIAFWELDNNGDDIEFYYGTCSASSGTLASKKLSQIKNMGGASSGAAGSAGFAPAPAAGDHTKYLRGDATWQAIPNMTGATSTVAGKNGLVPAPEAGDEKKVLFGDGTWKNLPASTMILGMYAGGRLPSGLYSYWLEYNNEIILISDIMSKIGAGKTIVCMDNESIIWNVYHKYANDVTFQCIKISNNNMVIHRLTRNGTFTEGNLDGVDKWDDSIVFTTT